MPVPLWSSGMGRSSVSSVTVAQDGALLRVQNYPHIDRVEEVLSSPREYTSNQEAFTIVSKWTTKELLRENSDNLAPYLVCAERGQGRHTLATLRRTLSKSAIRPEFNTETHGLCFVATGCSPEVMAHVMC